MLTGALVLFSSLRPRMNTGLWLMIAVVVALTVALSASYMAPYYRQGSYADRRLKAAVKKGHAVEVPSDLMRYYLMTAKVEARGVNDEDLKQAMREKYDHLAQFVQTGWPFLKQGWEIYDPMTDEYALNWMQPLYDRAKKIAATRPVE